MKPFTKTPVCEKCGEWAALWGKYNSGATEHILVNCVCGHTWPMRAKDYVEPTKGEN